MLLYELLKNATCRFTEAGFDSPDIEAAYMLEEVTGIRHNLLLFSRERVLTESELVKAENYLTRRLNHEPFQYICGWTQFRELNLAVSPVCLIPRPETEYLVDLVLKKLPRGGQVVELGTGSGAIALSIGLERKDAAICASELSVEALALAQKNLQRSHLTNVRLFQGDLFSPFAEEKIFDILVANLPYIPHSAKKDLPRNVRDYEPAMALFADHDGMALIEQALLDAPRYLKSGAALFFEAGEEQGDALCAFAAGSGFYNGIAYLQDQYGIPRFLYCELK